MRDDQLVRLAANAARRASPASRRSVCASSMAAAISPEVCTCPPNRRTVTGRAQLSGGALVLVPHRIALG
jgi:hypothetical protein